MQDREVMQMALDALLTWETMHPHTTANAVRIPSIEALRTALAQPDPEPVAWRWLYAGKPEGEQCFSMPSPDADIVARAAALEFPRTVQYLYTAPPKRKPNPFDGRKLSDYDNGYLHGFDDAMEHAVLWAGNDEPTPGYVDELNAAIKALRTALAQPEQEPVAWVDLDCWLHGDFWPDDCFSDEAQEGYTPLYTAPPQREWQGLTDEERQDIMEDMVNRTIEDHDVLFDVIEAKLKGKNT